MMAIWHIEAIQQEDYEDIVQKLVDIDDEKRLGLFVQHLVETNESFAKTLEAFIGYELMDRDIRKNSDLQ